MDFSGLFLFLPGVSENLREELLDMGLRYCWIDILCLRQECNTDDYVLVGGKGQRSKYTNVVHALSHTRQGSDTLRKAEWRVDIPTIGNIYQRAEHLVLYMNGLGRALDLNYHQNLEGNTRHWFNRAWTLQEMGGRESIDKRYFLGGRAVG